ncbi:MAG: DUF2804 domain-containing protein [Clostridiales bacterium]|nr:DUF2804 domain-containing protein [Clostridiales bacterium]
MRNTLLENNKVLLDKSGRPLQYGYATTPTLATNNEAINLFRLKEWDFYQISNEEFTVKITYGHISLAGVMSFEIFDYKNNCYALNSLIPFPLRRLGFAPSANSNIVYTRDTKNYKARIEVEDGRRHFVFDVKNKTLGDCHVDISLTHPVDDEGILVVTPFWHPKKFYHNYKQSCMKAEGTVFIDGKTFTIGDESLGLIDWARGNLPLKHKWWWGNGSKILGDDRFGFNIGGFGDTKYATENALFFNGKTHKLDDIYYNKVGKERIDFTSSDGRFEMKFKPIFDKVTDIELLYVDNICHQLFGYWNGYVVLDDGRKLDIKDMFAFVEFAKNQW